MIGQVYTLTNIAMPGLVKVGYSSDASERAKQLSSASGVPCEFDVAYVQDVEFPSETEAFAHKVLDDRRINDRREFFYADKAIAVRAIQLAALAILWNRAGPDAREEFLNRIDRPIMDKRYG